MKELSKKEVRQIRKLLDKRVDVPEICEKFNIPAEEWRNLVNKYELL